MITNETCKKNQLNECGTLFVNASKLEYYMLIQECPCNFVLFVLWKMEMEWCNSNFHFYFLIWARGPLHLLQFHPTPMSDHWRDLIDPRLTSRCLSSNSLLFFLFLFLFLFFWERATVYLAYCWNIFLQK